MIGDSITWSGAWWQQLRDQLLVREPGLGVTFRNCGVPGGGAEGALQRYDWDILPQRPTVALVMFGMNDVWRDAYVATADAGMIEGRNGCLQRYLIAMHALVLRLQHDGVRVALLTPSPYDQYSAGSVVSYTGVDDALAICAGMVRALGLALGVRVVDLHTPLRVRLAAGEQLISADRVHPAASGEQAMAELVVRELLPGPVAVLPSALHAASDALQAAERDARLIPMFRCWAGGSGDDDAALQRYLDQQDPQRCDDWMASCLATCRRLLPRQAEVASDLEQRQQQLTALV